MPTTTRSARRAAFASLIVVRGAVLGALLVGVGAGSGFGGPAAAAATTPAATATATAAAAATPTATVAARTPVALTDDRGRRVVLPGPAQRIVSLLPSLTETVCALQACDRLVGVDRSSNWPPQIAALPRLGGLEDTAIERIVSLRPDLVLAPASSRAIERLESLGLRVLALEPRDAADTQRVIATVAQAVGRPQAGEMLWRTIDARIAAAATRVPVSLRGSRVYFEVSEAPHAASEASFIGETLARLGLGNIVPAALGPFPQLNPEFVVRAAPDILMGSERAVAAMAGRPGWGTMAAVRERRQCGFGTADSDVLVRPGPRLGEAAERIADCLVALGSRAADGASAARGDGGSGRFAGSVSGSATVERGAANTGSAGAMPRPGGTPRP